MLIAYLLTEFLKLFIHKLLGLVILAHGTLSQINILSQICQKYIDLQLARQKTRAAKI